MNTVTMTTPTKIASALQRVRDAANQYHGHIVPTADISRHDREILIRTYWLQEITKGWYMLTRPDLAAGDSAAWYANFWDFLRIYLSQNYSKDYCLSAEASLELHTGSTLIPKQIVIIVPKGGTLLQLPYETSILTYADPKNIPEDRVESNGLQAMPLTYALCKVTPTYFRNNSDNAEIALHSIRAPSDITRVIIENNFQRAAERIIGAYQFIGLNNYAKDIQNALKTIGMEVTPKNPFELNLSVLGGKKHLSSYGARINLIWEKHRDIVFSHFPMPPGLPKQPDEYLNIVDELYEYDAYNSLSIEGYRVTPELIKRVQNNDWNPDLYEHDNQQRNALAARGYFEAYQSVKVTLNQILNGASPGKCVADDLNQWFQHLFAPSARANILSAADLIGYRNGQVYIRNSRHAPPPKEALLDCMDAFYSCLQAEESAAVRAVLGHYVFVFIHPFMDGNGRIARFILNTMLASGGYPWTIIQMKRRKQYIDNLEATHIDNNIEKFTQFIIEEMTLSASYLK